nr:hypothetical protein [Tanacetum cinerariifolium]
MQTLNGGQSFMSLRRMKVVILLSIRCQALHGPLRAVAWRSTGKFYQRFLEHFFAGYRPSPRLTSYAFEARADWWVSSRAFFDGHIREPPRIPSLVNLHSQDDPPVDIYRCMDEQDRVLKEIMLPTKKCTTKCVVNQQTIIKDEETKRKASEAEDLFK